MRRMLFFPFAAVSLLLGLVGMPEAAAPQATTSAQPAKWKATVPGQFVPAIQGITTPKEHLGFNLGDDYCLANYQQLHELLGQARKRVGSAQGRQHRQHRRRPAAAHGRSSPRRPITRNSTTTRRSPAGWRRPKASTPRKPPSWPKRARRSSGSTAACTPANRCAPRCSWRRFTSTWSPTTPNRCRILDDVIILFVHVQSRRHGPGRRQLHE